MGDRDIPTLLRRLGIEARRQGREWVALCPNPEHDDKKPGWRIRDESGSKKHGMHHCWACGFGGNVQDLVEKVLRIDWRAAKVWLATDAVADDVPVASSVELKMRPWDTSFRLPIGVEVGPIESWPGSPRKYALSRGILSWQVDRWGVGFAVEGRLEGRIVFVKRDGEGRPIGFSARTYVGDKRRYLEPEAWEGATASAIFGEQFWTADARRRFDQRVFVVEGAINALAIERACPVAPVAATSGSQLNPLVASKLATFGEVVAVTDPDAAGDALAEMLSNAFARHSKKFRRVRLPSGSDAASVPEFVLKESLGW